MLAFLLIRNPSLPAGSTKSSPKSVVILGGAHGSLALARSMGKAGVPVYYVSNDSPLAGWSRFAHPVSGWPGAAHPGALAFLLNLAERSGLKGALLVPAADAEVTMVSQCSRELSAAFTILSPDWESLQWLCDKPLLYKGAAALGLSFPKTYEISSVEEAQELEPEFPVILKPNMGGGNSALARAKVLRVDDRAALVAAFREAAAEAEAKNIVVQQLIPGGGECQFSYAALWRDGAPVAEFSARRGRQYPVDFGFTSTFVEVVEAPDVAVAARAILTSVRYSGLVEIEFKRDPRNGTLNILDVNPRPWSWFGLCAAANMDLGKAMWDVANGRTPTPIGPPRLSAAWMYLVRDVAAAAILMTRGKLKPAGYFSSFRSVRAWAAFSWHDVVPGLVDLPLTLQRVLTRRIFNRSK
jgi:predicted ATP-grasp superfamily ATP-dependent carboligase